MTKKGVRLRRIVDARLSKCYFTDAEKHPIMAGQTLGDLELASGEQLYVGHVDIKDAFWHFQLPEHSRRYFALPPVRARHVGITSLEGASVDGDTLLYPAYGGPPHGLDSRALVVPDAASPLG